MLKGGREASLRRDNEIIVGVTWHPAVGVHPYSLRTAQSRRGLATVVADRVSDQRGVGISLFILLGVERQYSKETPCSLSASDRRVSQGSPDLGWIPASNSEGGESRRGSRPQTRPDNEQPFAWNREPQAHRPTSRNLSDSESRPCHRRVWSPNRKDYLGHHQGRSMTFL